MTALAQSVGLAVDLDAAWRRWDDKPENVDRAYAYEAAATAAADELGTTPTLLRHRLALARQAGTPYGVAIERLGLPS